MRSSEAKLIFSEKYEHGPQVIVEIKIYQLPEKDWQRYPDKVKYSLICIDTKSKKKLLMDNHAPKGHHVHFGKTEKDYAFTSVENLFADFKKYVLDFMEVKL